jgi:hypothetical protein
VSGFQSVTAGATTFRWILIDDETRRIGMLLVTEPRQGTQAVQDMTELTNMLTAAGLEPEFEAQNVRMNRAASPPSVTVSWVGTVNDLIKAQAVLERMADHWRIG